MAFQFIGFDGNNHNLSYNLPSSVLEYNYYFIFRFEQVYKIICFNDEITVYKQGDKIIFKCPEGQVFREFHTPSNSSFDDLGEKNSESYYNFFNFVYSSENLLNYKDLIMTNNFTLPVPETEVSYFTLKPIVEEVQQKENIVESAFDEIFGILPVLIVILISFIGIRKGISYLFSLLRRS